MKRVLKLTSVLMVMAMVLSSCVTIRQFSFSKTNLDLSANDLTSMRLRLKPDSSTSSLDGYAFVLVGIDDELVNLNRKEWQDFDGDWGMAPAAVQHNALRNALRSDGVCSLPGAGDAEDIDGLTWQAFRSNVEIDFSDIDATSRLNFVHNLGIDHGSASVNEVAQVVAITGLWADDGDANPEVGTDTFICNSAIFTSVTFRS